MVRTTYTGTSITVSFYGRSDVAEVRADVGSPTNVKPYRTERRVNRNLPAGATRQMQSGKDGFYVSLTRTIVRERRRDLDRRLVQRLRAGDGDRGVQPGQAKPEPEPEPEPEPDRAVTGAVAPES